MYSPVIIFYSYIRLSQKHFWKKQSALGKLGLQLWILEDESAAGNSHCPQFWQWAFLSLSWMGPFFFYSINTDENFKMHMADEDVTSNFSV